MFQGNFCARHAKGGSRVASALHNFAFMGSTEMPPLRKLAGAEAHFDSPQPHASAYAESISVAGWCHLPGRNAESCRLRAWVENSFIGETPFLFVKKKKKKLQK